MPTEEWTKKNSKPAFVGAAILLAYFGVSVLVVYTLLGYFTEVLRLIGQLMVWQPI